MIKAEVLAQLEAAGQFPSDPQLQAKIKAIIAELGDDVAEVLEDGAISAAERGALRSEIAAHTAGMTVTPGARVDLLETIRSSTFRASARTLEAVTGDVMGALATSVEQGLGEAEAAKLLDGVFDNLSQGKLRSIVRTELTAFESEAAMLRNVELGVNLHEWFTALDDRVRPSHENQHAMIVKIGDVWPNGLRFPGDQIGSIEEWVDCRCQALPFILEAGQMAPPGQPWFFASDVGTADPLT